MHVLVTGHRGYIGAVMVPMLLEAGHTVVGLDSDLFGECSFREGLAPVPELRADVRDVLPAHLEGFDAVVHLAGENIAGRWTSTKAAQTGMTTRSFQARRWAASPASALPRLRRRPRPGRRPASISDRSL